ncbi:MAG: RNA pseudouridine synthase [Treponema sp.]|jgi:23S rRNA pseudouridine955/2504/2580 synthase|nr:RNA pseudouridine synthase [Treponema sp.]
MNSLPTIPIIYDNSEIFIINKKAGMSVQGGEKVSHPLDEELSRQTGQKVYLVHRLDKDTSGLMIVAKTPAAASKWTKLIGSKEVEKEYIAICIGTLPQKQGVINEDLVQHGQTKTAVTHYKVLEEQTVEWEGQKIILSKVSLVLQTGRMHQIRIHLAKQGCPIAGDDQHGNFKLNKVLRKAAGIKHLQLFSVRLTIPLDGKNTVFTLDY